MEKQSEIKPLNKIEKLQIVAITSMYVVIADSANNVVGFAKKEENVSYSLGNVLACQTDDCLPVIVATPGSYHARMYVRPCFYSPEGFWWSECKNTKEIVLLESNKRYHLCNVSVAANAKSYAHFPLYVLKNED